MPYHHITRENRIEIRTLLRAGNSKSEVAKQLGFHPSTIGREIKRNLDAKRQYNYEHANSIASRRRCVANQHHRVLSVVLDRKEWNQLTRIVERKIRQLHWSPEQVSGWLKARKGIVVAAQTIYDWIYGFAKHLRKFLHHIRGGYRKSRARYILKKQRDARRAERGIDKRPAHISSRTRYGHWEGDTVLGRGSSGRIATLVERKSGYTIAFLIKRLSGELAKLDETELEVRRQTMSLRFADGVT